MRKRSLSELLLVSLLSINVCATPVFAEENVPEEGDPTGSISEVIEEETDEKETVTESEDGSDLIVSAEELTNTEETVTSEKPGGPAEETAVTEEPAEEPETAEEEKQEEPIKTAESEPAEKAATEPADLLPEEAETSEEITEEPELLETDGIAIEPADSPTLYGFVTRMYETVLGREPDINGYADWTLKLYNHQKTAADIVHGFFFSQEYLRRNKSNAQIVTDYYRAMLNRTPDSEGNQYWQNRLNVGMTMDAISAGFVGSPEFRALCSKYGIEPGTVTFTFARDTNYERTYFVYRLYKNCLQREPDIPGLEDWVSRLKNGETGVNVAYGFVFSKEYSSKNVDNNEFVNMLYRTILGREPEAEGKRNWVNALNNGTSRIKVFNGFLMSQEFSNQCVIAEIDPGEPLPAPEDKQAETPTRAVSGGPYVLNVSSKIFHLGNCGSVAVISESNKAVSSKSRQEIINMGYTPCKRCNP